MIECLQGRRLALASVWLVWAWLVVGTATALDFTPHGTQPGLVIATESSENCASCHEGATALDQSLLPHAPWSGSMMANATRDPLFWAALDVANRDMPGVGDYCLRCHTPDGWLAGRVVKDGQGGTVNGANGCALQGDLDNVDSKINDFGGITCSVCHRTASRGPQGQQPILYNANLWIDDSTSCNGSFGPCKRGPYRYPAVTPVGTIDSPPHGWIQERYFEQSAFCGSCHTVDSPDTDQGPARTLILNDGTDTGMPFPLDRTFGEWQASAYADVILRDGLENDGSGTALPASVQNQTCQTCHMRNSSSASARACIFTPPGSRQNNLPVHEFAGSNYWMVDVLKAAYGGPGQLNRQAAFDQTRAWIVENLTERSAELSVALAPLAAGNTTLSATVEVTNKTGHKLPNGYAEGRRMWLHVQAFDGNDQLLFESGAYDPATAVLSADPQLKVYEAVHGVWERFGVSGQCVTADPVNGRKHFNMTLNNCIAKDNRIPPLGFRGALAPDLRPVGYTYPETQPGSGILVNYDRTTYSIPVSQTAVRPIRVRAALRFQVTSKDYIEFLRDEAQLSAIPSEDQMCNRVGEVGPMTRTRGQYMLELWQNNGKAAPLDMVVRNATSTSTSVTRKEKR